MHLHRLVVDTAEAAEILNKSKRWVRNWCYNNYTKDTERDESLYYNEKGHWRISLYFLLKDMLCKKHVDEMDFLQRAIISVAKKKTRTNL